MEHEVAPMLFIMFIAGLLANMNVYTTGFDDACKSDQTIGAVPLNLP